jgi:acyl-coenzyme A thioesterase PaaI-like protein
MQPPQERLSEADVRSFLSSLAFIREYAITVVSIIPGQVTIELPFHERFSGRPGQFPASVVGAAGDVAAVASCLSLLPKGWALATLDFTIKMTGAAKGERGACYKPVASIRWAEPTSISFRRKRKSAVAPFLPPREIFRS